MDFIVIIIFFGEFSERWADKAIFILFIYDFIGDG